jgi:hypothetical protein
MGEHDMEQKPISRKMILVFLMVGVVACLMVLLAMYRQRGYVGRTGYLGVGIGYLISCATLFICAWVQNKTVKDKAKSQDQ